MVERENFIWDYLEEYESVALTSLVFTYNIEIYF